MTHSYLVKFWFLTFSSYIFCYFKVSLATDFMYNYMSKDVTTSVGYDYILRQVSAIIAYIMI